MAIFDLQVHPSTYVTVGELADYWRVSRAYVLAQVYAGHFEAIHLGPGIYRVRTSTARRFEEGALMPASYRPDLLVWPTNRPAAAPPGQQQTACWPPEAKVLADEDTPRTRTGE